jgi:hypothetical protein
MTMVRVLAALRKMRVRSVVAIAAALVFGVACRGGSGSTMLEPTREAVPATYFGMHIHRADRGTGWPSVPFATWRLWDADVVWANLETAPGKWTWERLDQYVELAARHGVELVMPLALSPRWASARPDEPSSYGPGLGAEPRSIDAWRNYVRTVATRYKGRIQWYEVWNEVNDKGYFTGSVEMIVRLTAEANRIVKEIDPGNRIVSPSIVADLKYFDRVYGAGLGQHVDVIGYHFYAPSVVPEKMLIEIAEVRRLMTKHGLADKPLWNTEVGWAVTNEDGSKSPHLDPRWAMLSPRTAAAYMSRALIVNWAAGVQRYCAYSWDHSGMGFIEPKAGTHKPIAHAYGQTAAWLSGARIEQCAKGGDTWTCQLETKDNNRAWIVWTESGATNTFKPPHEWQVTETITLGGAPRAFAEQGSVEIGDAPVMLRRRAPSKGGS